MNTRQQKMTVKKLVRQRDAAWAEAVQLKSELANERSERATLVADLRQSIADFASCITARDATIATLHTSFEHMTRAFKSADAQVESLTLELKHNASGVMVKTLRKRLQAKTERVVVLEGELEKLRPTGIRLDIQPRVIGVVKP